MESRFLVLPETAFEEGGTVSIVALPDAKHGSRQLALGNGKVLELNVMQRRLGSFFVDGTVHGTSRLYVASAMDPLFALLPVLEKVLEKARPFHELLSEGGECYLQVARTLRNNEAEQACELLCDVTEIPGLEDRFFRLNCDKVLRWLLCKMDLILAAFENGEAGRSAMGAHAVAASLQLSVHDAAAGGDNAESQESKKIAAIEILGEYVGPYWMGALYRHFGLSQNAAKKASFNAHFDTANMPHVTSRFGEKAPAPKAKESEMTMGQKRLRKADTTGMKPLGSFFAPKKPAKAAPTTPKKPSSKASPSKGTRSSPRLATPSPKKKSKKSE